MKLRNKKTGKIIETDYMFGVSIPTTEAFGCKSYDQIAAYSSLTELNEEWEDYEEPKEYWYINSDSVIYATDYGKYPDSDLLREEIGNYFETKEEAEKAVEKLKAWKRLKEAGFEFGGWTHTPITKSLTGYNLHIKAYSDKLADFMDDLQLLFGGEE